MEIELVALVVGAILPIFVGLLRRKFIPSRNQIQVFILAVSGLIFLGIDAFRGELNQESLVGRVTLAYASSQLVYNLVIKNLSLDLSLEGGGE